MHFKYYTFHYIFIYLNAISIFYVRKSYLRQQFEHTQDYFNNVNIVSNMIKDSIKFCVTWN